jgi:hypothetical protein
MYEGDWENGKKKGRGVMRWENGDVYEGEFDQDKFHGYGVLTKTDGSSYAGEWKESRRHGRGNNLFQSDFICHILRFTRF